MCYESLQEARRSIESLIKHDGTFLRKRITAFSCQRLRLRCSSKSFISTEAQVTFLKTFKNDLKKLRPTVLSLKFFVILKLGANTMLGKLGNTNESLIFKLYKWHQIAQRVTKNCAKCAKCLTILYLSKLKLSPKNNISLKLTFPKFNSQFKCFTSCCKNSMLKPEGEKYFLMTQCFTHKQRVVFPKKFNILGKRLKKDSWRIQVRVLSNFHFLTFLNIYL